MLSKHEKISCRDFFSYSMYHTGEKNQINLKHRAHETKKSALGSQTELKKKGGPSLKQWWLVLITDLLYVVGQNWIIWDSIHWAKGESKVQYLAK